MTLSEKLKQARLEAGLSQKQLCGDRITRNMLSQIENGSARPSMDTLKYFADRLGKSVSYFLEETAVTSPNQVLMEQARQAEPEKALTFLGQYRAPDPVFDRERWLLETLCCLDLAETVLKKGQKEYARNLLLRAAEAGAHTPYYTPELEEKRLLLARKAGMDVALPDISEGLLLRAEEAMQAGAVERAAAFLESCGERPDQWHFLRGQVLLAQKEYARALAEFSAVQTAYPRQSLQAMEVCCRELGDYRGAYECACKLRETE